MPTINVDKIFDDTILFLEWGLVTNSLIVLLEYSLVIDVTTKTTQAIVINRLATWRAKNVKSKPEMPFYVIVVLEEKAKL